MKNRDKAYLFYPYQIYKYVIYFPFLGIVTAILSILAVTAMFLFGQNAGKLMPIWWARLNSWATPMFVTLKGTEHIDKNQSYIIVSNHQSQFDIFVIYGWIPIDFKWVMKMQLRKVPFIGYFCYKMGHVYIDRSNPEAAKASINAAKKTITGGTSILFFPEGSRGDTGELLPFKKGAFKLALDMNLPLLPVNVINSRNVLPNKSLALFPGKAELVIHKPIPIDGYNESNIHELMEKARKVIAQGLMDNGQNFAPHKYI